MLEGGLREPYGAGDGVAIGQGERGRAAFGGALDELLGVSVTLMRDTRRTSSYDYGAPPIGRGVAVGAGRRLRPGDFSSRTRAQL
ncbi:hypothetical protein ACFV7R_44480 [Streptomyces sp. NPDC059866]|uniref:hypothetical protein n=1 Tax=Streptomyces sp. NPDC059866 TaxID=3346978 RepID=UPI00364A9F6C